MEAFLKWANRIFDLFLAVLFFLFMAVGVYLMLDARSVYLEAQDYAEIRNHLPQEEITEEALKEISGNVIAWIRIENTPVDYPIVQGQDNMEYLSRDPEGNYSMAGSIFLDCRNRADFSEPYQILYGHHMPDKLMFGALDDFEDPAYFDSHRDGLLSLPGVETPFRTVAFLTVPAGCSEIFDPAQKTDYRRFFSENAGIWYPEDADGRLVALTTCAEDADHFRKVLVIALKTADSAAEHAKDA